jgi:salicylate hydroxylase
MLRIVYFGLILTEFGKSRTVAGLTGQMPERKSTGQQCFRFLVPREKLATKPDVLAFMNKVGYQGLNAFICHDRRLVIYPCREGALLNIVAFHPAGSEAGITNDSSWLSSGQQKDLDRAYETFCPELRGLCSLAEDLKLWSLASRDPPKTFWRAKLVLIGDAAHPTLPRKSHRVLFMKIMLMFLAQ